MVMRRLPGPDSHFGLAPSAARCCREVIKEKKRDIIFVTAATGQRQDTTLQPCLNGKINQTSDAISSPWEGPLNFCISHLKATSASADGTRFLLLSGRSARRPAQAPKVVLVGRNFATPRNHGYCASRPGETDTPVFQPPCHTIQARGT